MQFSEKIKNMAVFIEFLAGAGLAIFFHLVLDNPEAAYSIFGIGILLSLTTYLLREEMEDTRDKLMEQYQHAHEITFAISQIINKECQAKAQDLLASTKRTIAQLQQGYISLGETEFYLEGAKCTDSACQRLKAVDPMTTGWDTRGILVNFYQANLHACERGVFITRIFVMNRDELSNPEVQTVLLMQHRDGIDVRIAFRDELPTTNGISDRDITSSYDFAIYDDQTATEAFPQTGTYFGRKTSHPLNVEKHLRLYELIEHSAYSIAEDCNQIILAPKKLKQAV